MSKGRPLYQYQPYNETPDVAIGLLLPFNKSSKARTPSAHYASGSTSGGNVFGQSYTTEEQAVSNLKNLLLTTKGERYMQPNFGTNITDMLFENNTIDAREILTDTLTEDIEYWLPYITVNDVELISSPDMHSLTIRLHFRITTVGANLVINILATENEFTVSEPEASIVSRFDQELVEVGTFNTNAGIGGIGGQY